MAFYGCPPSMRGKEPLRGFPVSAEIASVKPGKCIDLSPQGAHLVVKIFLGPPGHQGFRAVICGTCGRRGMHQKVELHLLSVDMPVQIHDAAFSAAHIKHSQHMKDTDRTA